MQNSSGKQNTIKMDRNILQRLLTAYQAGCTVNLENILQHEPMTVPLSFVEYANIFTNTVLKMGENTTELMLYLIGTKGNQLKQGQGK